MSRSAALRCLVPAFTVGLALGCGAWFAYRLATAGSAVSSTARVSTGSATAPDLPAWAWRESLRPPPLPAATLVPATDAWLALRGADGSPVDPATRLDTLRALLARLDSGSFPRLLDPLFASTDPTDRPLLTIAFTAWAELDAPAAARWLATLAEPSDWARTRLAPIAAHAWMALDPLAASTWACALQDGSLARTFARIVLPALARQDPRRAHALAVSRDNNFLNNVLNDVLAALAESDPAAALRTFGSGLFQQGGGGFLAVRTPLTRWMQSAPTDALRWLADETHANDHAWFDTLDDLSRNDAVLTRTLLDTLLARPEIPRNRASLGQLFSRWATEDSSAALQWFEKIDAPDLRASLLAAASSSPDLEHPEKGLPFALARADSQDRTNTLTRILGEWAARAPTEALAWIAQHAEDPGVAAASKQAQAAILGTIALTEPATAVAEYQALQDIETRKAARDAIADAWAKHDPGAAHLWRTAQNEALGYPPLAGHSVIFHAWSRRDPLAALRWAEQVSPPRSREFYLKALTDSGVDSMPRAAAADLYAQLKDPTERVAYVTQHLRQWLIKDRAAARAWLESHDILTADQVAALLQAKSE